MGKCPMEEFYNQIRQWFNPTKHMDQVSKQRDLRDLHGNNTFAISCLCQADEYDRSDATMTIFIQENSEVIDSSRIRICSSKPSDQETRAEITKPSRIAEYRRSGSAPTLDLLPGESRGYWKHHAPGNWFRQDKIVGKVHNEKGNLLLDTRIEVSIVNIAFARKVGIYIDSSQIRDCVRIGDNVYRTEGRTRIKVTLAESFVYCFDIWVGDLSGQEAIFGMTFMVRARIRLYLVHGSIRLPDEVRIQLCGRRHLYCDKARAVNLGQYLRIQPGES
ncbi:LOW QUALITY PROTEIN: hypothetical protein PHMEG_00034883, partial [Phytophthora megakarya]